MNETPESIKTAPPRNLGFTLLEVSVAVAVLSVIVVSTATLAVRSQRHFTEEMQLLRIDETGWRVINRIAEELRSDFPGSVLPLVLEDSTQIQFQKVIGYDEIGPILGGVIVIQYELAPGETANGSDDNELVSFDVEQGDPENGDHYFVRVRSASDWAETPYALEILALPVCEADPFETHQTGETSFTNNDDWLNATEIALDGHSVAGDDQHAIGQEPGYRNVSVADFRPRFRIVRKSQRGTEPHFLL